LTTLVSASATEEVRVRLDLFPEPLARDIDVNRQVEPAHHRIDAPPQPTARERRGQDPVGEIAQLGVALLGVLERVADERLSLSVAIAQGLPCELQRDDGVHQALLRAVVQIAHDATACIVAGGEESSA
jgi:hypothetical protein